eukprot:750977-Hanusia_phi.AAC.1
MGRVIAVIDHTRGKHGRDEGKKADGEGRGGGREDKNDDGETRRPNGRRRYQGSCTGEGAVNNVKARLNKWKGMSVEIICGGWVDAFDFFALIRWMFSWVKNI